MDPVAQFNRWYQKELDRTNTGIPSACCLSTTGTDGYPNARFVSLKEVKNGRFIITGPMNSRKGSELGKNPRAALTFWWPATGKQVRVQGDAELLDPARSDQYFLERPRDARIAAVVSEQGKPTESPELLKKRMADYQARYGGREIPRPEHWGGIGIIPVRIEFLNFKQDRLHERALYTRDGEAWHRQWLQP